jgi:hypothetical protein
MFSRAWYWSHYASENLLYTESYELGNGANFWWFCEIWGFKCPKKSTILPRFKTARTGLYPILHSLSYIRGCVQKFWTESITKYTLTTINTRWEATQRVMAAKLTRLAHKISIQLHIVAESSAICSSRSRRPVRKLLVIPSYVVMTWYSVKHRDNFTLKDERTRDDVTHCGPRNAGNSPASKVVFYLKYDLF